MTLSQFRASEPVSQFPCLKNGVQSNTYSLDGMPGDR